MIMIRATREAPIFRKQPIQVDGLESFHATLRDRYHAVFPEGFWEFDDRRLRATAREKGVIGSADDFLTRETRVAELVACQLFGEPPSQYRFSHTNSYASAARDLESRLMILEHDAVEAGSFSTLDSISLMRSLRQEYSRVIPARKAEYEAWPERLRSGVSPDTFEAELRRNLQISGAVEKDTVRTDSAAMFLAHAFAQPLKVPMEHCHRDGIPNVPLPPRGILELRDLIESEGDRGPLLDVGSATGTTLASLSLFSESRTLTGIDVDPASVRVARETAHRLPAKDRLRFILGDAKEIDLGPYISLFLYSPFKKTSETQAAFLRRLCAEARIRPMRVYGAGPINEDLAECDGLTAAGESTPSGIQLFRSRD
jgi:hypothetical protein